MALFHIYGDESGKMGLNVDRTSYCGFVGHVSQWQVFAQNWTNCRFKWQVPPLHMTRIMFPDNKDDEWKKVKDDWGKSWEDKRKLMLEDFASIVRSSDIICVGAVVDAAHFRNICDSDPDFKKFHKNPVHFAFHTFVMRGIEKVETVDKYSPIGIVVDNDQEYSMRIYGQLEGLKISFPKVKERIHSLSFVDDSSYPGVQAADMIAYESRRIMVERISNPDSTSDLYDNLTFMRVHQPHYYPPEVLNKMQQSLAKGIADGTIKI